MSTVMPNPVMPNPAMPNPVMPNPAMVAPPMAAQFGAQIPGAPTPQAPMNPGFAPQGSVTQTGKGKQTVFCVGYIAPQRNAIKRTIDEAASRKSFKLLYEGLSEDEKAAISAKAVLTNDGEPVKPDKEGKVKTMPLTSTFSMTAFRTFFRQDGRDKDGKAVSGFETIRQKTTYAVDMSENSVEFWVMRCLTPGGFEMDMDVDTAFRAGHISDMGKRIACFKTKQLYHFVNALNQAHFPIVSLASLNKAVASNVMPTPIGYFSFKANTPKTNSTNKTTSVSIGVYDTNYAKRSVRQLGINDDDQRVEEVAYIVLRNNVTGNKENITEDMVTNSAAFKLLFGGQEIGSLSPRKTFTKAEYARPGMTEDEVNASYKAAKIAEHIAYDINKVTCEAWGLTADKYNQLTSSKSSKPSGVTAATFMESSDNATQAIRALLNAKNK